MIYLIALQTHFVLIDLALTTNSLSELFMLGDTHAQVL